ncbi:hypothetical protein FGO68_gene10559 [Halteria grandinella]|uniref:Uncharacterized protein n=1 Tax=Halteria grandinella TaxID=5974 RepID=A0A8J8NBE9_HALGN|nr:hypothetical protein FGO68_gene10559 [Halteria grandinella]
MTLNIPFPLKGGEKQGVAGEVANKEKAAGLEKKLTMNNETMRQFTFLGKPMGGGTASVTRLNTRNLGYQNVDSPLLKQSPMMVKNSIMEDPDEQISQYQQPSTFIKMKKTERQNNYGVQSINGSEYHSVIDLDLIEKEFLE